MSLAGRECGARLEAAEATPDAHAVLAKLDFARIELRVLYAELLARWPEIRRDSARPAEITGANVIGFQSLIQRRNPA